MLKRLTRNERLDMLADHILSSPHMFHMDCPAHCIYGHACRLFGRDWAEPGDPARILSDLLDIGYGSAFRLYWGGGSNGRQYRKRIRTRQDAADALHSLIRI